ncbi:hypothetical protein [Comamonas testosteroni]|uniref:hypothetical protein n=1 Tax=Comamonas testosteroni TaxID=285 RepID=UPI0005B3C24F|nr:hypothetical protein [Comamonas testosteroni]
MRTAQVDPRTVARDIPGLLKEVFPQLTPGIVAHFNHGSRTLSVDHVSQDLIAESRLQRSMLFELSYTVGESLLLGAPEIDWDQCFADALKRQSVYFDAQTPGQLCQADKVIAETVGRNLWRSLSGWSGMRNEPLKIRPAIPGFEWISNGQGDFSLGSTLIEVKNTVKRFSSADYRQVAIYWLLSYASAIEGRGEEWQDFILFNARSGEQVSMTYDAFLKVISSGRTKVEILQHFQALVGNRNEQR